MTTMTQGEDLQEDHFDVAAVGSALVDVVVELEDEDLARLGLAKGAMTLVDATEADALGSLIEALPLGTTRRSGGSSANTVVGVAALGGKVAYIGKVGEDGLGGFFLDDMEREGAAVFCSRAAGHATGHCMVFVTPDGERTMATHLGAASGLAPDDVVPAVLSRSGIVYLEGYLWDLPQAKEAMRLAMELARNSGGRVAFTLSDPFCVDRHRVEFLDLLRGPVDLVFANEAEVASLFRVDDLEAAVPELARMDLLAAVTRGERGSLVIDSGVVAEVDPVSVSEVVDTTGAGDLYAAGFLFGLSRQLGHEACARLGSLCAAEVITHLGARPVASLAAVAGAAGVLG